MKLILREHILTVSMIFGAAASILLGSFTAFARDCEELPEKLFRLHILANSDSEEDQKLKYALRDYLIEDMDEVFSGCKTAGEAEKAAKENLTEIARKSQQFVYDSGFDYKITASVENVFFTTRRYGSTVVPAGNYDSLRILIGEGEGQNWWCVMFPPLCLGAVEEYVTADQDILMCKPGIQSRLNGSLSDDSSERIQQDQPVEVKFALFEWITGLFN